MCTVKPHVSMGCNGSKTANAAPAPEAAIPEPEPAQPPENIKRTSSKDIRSVMVQPKSEQGSEAEAATVEPSVAANTTPKPLTAEERRAVMAAAAEKRGVADAAASGLSSGWCQFNFTLNMNFSPVDTAYQGTICDAHVE